MLFRSERNSNWEGAYRVPCFVRWPGHFLAGKTLNGIVSHEDWLPTLAAAAGGTDIKDQLAQGVELNGRKYRNYEDGCNQLSYTYNDWFLDRAFALVPMQQMAGKFLVTMKDYPPSQTPGSFNPEKIQRMIEARAGAQ